MNGWQMQMVTNQFGSQEAGTGASVGYPAQDPFLSMMSDINPQAMDNFNKGRKIGGMIGSLVGGGAGNGAPAGSDTAGMPMGADQNHKSY